MAGLVWHAKTAQETAGKSKLPCAMYQLTTLDVVGGVVPKAQSIFQYQPIVHSRKLALSFSKRSLSFRARTDVRFIQHANRSSS